LSQSRSAGIPEAHGTILKNKAIGKSLQNIRYEFDPKI
jgi:hypothetical protein